MPQIVITQRATQDLQRFERYLNDVAPDKVAEAILTILEKIELLKTNPEIGAFEPLNSQPIQLRKLVIPYGKNGYVVLYLFDKQADVIRIETIRHMRELRPEFLRKS